MSNFMTGEVINMGTMTVNGEEMDGVFVRMSKDEIRAVQKAPMYDRVALVPVGEGEIQPVMDALENVYGALWVEAHYDPTSDPIRKFCTPLADKMRAANVVLKFKP